MQIVCRTEEETRELGHQLATALDDHAIVLLHGDLGAGKTVLCQGLARGLGVPVERVQSPTFTLVHEYEGDRPLIHVDLYRLAEEEVVEAGVLEVLERDGIKAVEWADRLTWIPEGALALHLRVVGETRQIDIEPEEGLSTEFRERYGG